MVTLSAPPFTQKETMDHDQMINQLQQAAASFRHQAECIRRINTQWPGSINSNAADGESLADHHAQQIELIIQHLSAVNSDTN